MTMQTEKKRREILPIVIAVTLAVIWGHSLLGREASSEESSFVMRLLAPFLELIVGKGNVTEHLVRKLAHYGEFTVLGLELCLYFAGKASERKKRLLLSISHGLFAAFMDETIQIFSGRGPEISDVWIDLAGVLTGSLAVLAVLFLRGSSGKT